MGISDDLPRSETSFIRDIADVKRDIRELGPSIAKSFAPIIAGIQATVIKTVQESYTTTVDLKNMLLGKSDTNHKHSAADITTGGTTGAGFTVGGELTATGDVRAPSFRGTDVYATAAPGFNITGTRVTAWLESATGRLGTASSSERYKTNVTPFDIDPEQILSIAPVFYQYREAIAHAEWRRTCGPPYAEWDPKARAPMDAGMIAERLHEAGLWPFVVYRRDAWGRLIRGDDGDVVPDGIHYINWGIALQHVARWERDQRVALERRVDAIAAHLGLDLKEAS